MILINALIILLSTLIIIYLCRLIYNKFSRFFYYFGLRVREGLENADDASAPSGSTYTDPGLNNNPLYLSTLNAANISYLKDQVDQLTGLTQTVSSLQTKVDSNTKGIAALGNQFTQTAQQVTGRDPNSTAPLPTVTGI